jgi:RNA polymerase sigma factor (sigma-70 family)
MSSRLRVARDTDRPLPPLTADQQKLVASVLDLVDAYARKLVPGVAGPMLDDLVAQGRFGACVAATRFVPGGPARFSSFAIPFIVGEMKDWIHGEGRHRRLLRAGSAAARAFVAETPDGFEVTWDDDATLRNKLRSFVDELLAAMAAGMAAAVPEPEELVVVADVVAVVRKALDEVEESERKVYRLRYVEGLTLEKAAARLGVSERTVRRWQEALLDNVAARLRAEGITEMPERWVALPEEEGGDERGA